MPFASSLISSLSMEKLRSYYQIPNNIDFKLPDNPTKSTIDEEDSVVYFTREQLVVGFRIPISSLVKQFLHFSRAPLALICPNVIQILIGYSLLNLLYQLDISLVEVCFIYTLKLVFFFFFFFAGKNRRGKLVNWVEKASFKKIQRLLEISERERHHEIS